MVRDGAGDVSPQWNGHGNFRAFLEALPLGDLRIDWSMNGGLVYDPGHHVPDPIAGSADPAQTRPDSVQRPEVVLPMLRAAALPPLAPRRYAAALAALARVLGEAEFSLMQTGKRVRDLCVERNEPVSRRDVNQLLRSLLYGGFDPAGEDKDVGALVSTVCDIAVAACTREAMAVDDAMRLALARWIGGAGEAGDAQGA